MRVAEIESWFCSQVDGEFTVLPSDFASLRDGNFANAETVLYTTKPFSLPRVQSRIRSIGPIAAMARPGLPRRDDLPDLRRSRNSIQFIGDADPPDLMIYAWLREYVPIIWHGVSDTFFEVHETQGLPIRRIPMSATELLAIDLLQRVCPDYRDLVGPFCWSALDAGYKIEVEGAVHQEEA